MKYIHYFFAYIIFIIELVLSVFFCIIPANIMKLFGAKKASKNWYKKFAHALASQVECLLNVKVHVIGEENLPKDTGNLAFVANHQSLLDIVLIYGTLHLSPVPIAKVEVLKMPFIRSYAKGLDTILIDRKSPKSSMAAIHEATDRLVAGDQCIIFPEGTRSKNGKIGELKSGSYKMALRANSTLVPIVINGTRAALEEKKGWHRYHVYVQVLPPVSLGELDKFEKKAIAEQVSADIVSAYSNLPAIKK